MTWVKTYAIATETANGLVNAGALHKEIEDASLPGFIGTRPGAVGQIKIEFSSSLNSADETSLDNILAAHQGVSFVDPRHVEATGDITTTSTTYTPAAGMILSPAASGTFLIWLSTIMENSSNGKKTYVSIFLNGSKLNNSEKWVKQQGGSSEETVVSVVRTSVSAGQTVEVYWKVDGGTGKMVGARSLYLTEIA